MPTVVVNWNGQCTEARIQAELCAKIKELGEISNRLHKDFYGQKIQSRVFDGQTAGKVLLSGALAAGVENRAGLEQAAEGTWALQDARLFGVQFALFDPRRFNSPLMMAHAYDTGFIFLRCADPALDGQVVQVITLRSNDARRASAELMLDLPEMDLRYYLERWMGELLGWVKRFYIPNLHYWIWKDNPHDRDYEDIPASDRTRRDEIFIYLREAFVTEAKEWEALMRKNKVAPAVPVPQPKTRAEDDSSWDEDLNERFEKNAREDKLSRGHHHA
jgi:hypothetical protein